VTDIKKMYIGGEWMEAIDGGYYEDRDPYTGEVFSLVANGGAKETQLAVDAASKAFPMWKAYSPTEKRKLFYRAADLLEERMDDFVDALSRETGAAKPFALFQAANSPEFLREAGSMALNVHGEIFPSDDPDCVNMMWRQPMGVIGCISPWNAALLLALRAIVFPLACGDTVVMKTSEASSVVGGIMIAKLFEDAGFPKGVLNLVTNGPGRSREVGDVLTNDKRVRCITFTGSTDVGRALNIQCAKNLKKFVSELGGNCPLIIAADANIDYAVSAAAFGRFMHQGQVCMNTKRIIVEEPVAEEFISKLAEKAKSLRFGDPKQEDTIIGPVINQSQLDILIKQVENARAQGATIVTGGHNHGLVYEPTVLVMTEEMDISQEEVFGPVANVIIAADTNDALRIANNTNYGLSSAVISSDTIKAWEIAEKLEAGCCHINDSTLGDDPHAPLGGMKDSGNGKNGFRAIEEFTDVRWVTMQKHPKEFLF